MRAHSHEICPKFRHVVMFTRGAFRPSNTILRRVFKQEDGRPPRVLAVVDKTLLRVRPAFLRELHAYFAAHSHRAELVGIVSIPGGEDSKNDWRLVEKLWATIEHHNLSRQSYVLAIGGGALLDLAGFATATAHRGVRLVRMPTTALSQADGGVGVKNGVNYFGKKNWVGAFAVPSAVINDLDFLRLQPAAAARGGIVEAFKVGLIRDAKLALYIERNAARLARRERKPFERVVRESARLHLRHIATGGDPFEMGASRPLDFGHWAAHKLEQMSGFRLAHGDSVAVGVALDARYSAACGWLPERDALRIVNVLEQLGCDTGNGHNISLVKKLLLKRGRHGVPEVLSGLEEFRQHLGGALTITLLKRWGRGMETNEMKVQLIRKVIDIALS